MVFFVRFVVAAIELLLLLFGYVIDVVVEKLRWGEEQFSYCVLRFCYGMFEVVGDGESEELNDECLLGDVRGANLSDLAYPFIHVRYVLLKLVTTDVTGCFF